VTLLTVFLDLHNIAIGVWVHLSLLRRLNIFLVAQIVHVRVVRLYFRISPAPKSLAFTKHLT